MLLIACDDYAAALYASSKVLSEFGKKRFRIIGVFFMEIPQLPACI